VNVDRGQTQANEVITRLGAGAQAGRVSLFLEGTRAQVVVDLVSVVVPTRRSGTQLLTALADPKRVLDSRKGLGTSTGRKSGPVVLTLPAGMVPTGATGVVLNVTTTEANRIGYVTVHRAGSRDPGTSNVNFRSGTHQANQVVTGVDGQRRVTLRVGGGAQTHLVVDVVAYLTGG
jgi:hypothetical protein